MSITLRNIKGSPLTHEEMDENFSALTGSLDAGNGLTGGGFLPTGVEFNVGQGDGISVSADSIAVNSTVARTGSNVFTGPQNIQSALTASSALLGGFTYPTTDASFGFVLATDGSGNLFFQQATSGSITSSGAIFPFTGSAGILGSLNVDGTITATTSVTVNNYTLPTADGASGSIVTTDGSGTLSFGSVDSLVTFDNVEINIKAGEALTKGDPVYISGTVGASERAIVSKADASDSSKMPAIGLVQEDMSTNDLGKVTLSGFLRNITTDPIDGVTPSSNDTVYVKAGGGLTLTKPSGSNLIQNIAKVGKVSGGSAGTLIVSAILRTNDVPNLLNGEVFFGVNDKAVQKPLSDILSGSEFTYSGSFSGSFVGPSINVTSGSFTRLDATTGNIVGLTGTTSTYTSGSFTRLDATTGNVATLTGTTSTFTSASLSRLDVTGNSTLNGDLTVTGRVTAEEFHTEFVSASIIYQSGSTKFGDTSDDRHSFTGSVEILGSLTGSSNIDIAGTVDANVYSINGTTVIDSSRNITGSNGTFSGNVDVASLDSTGNVDANTFSIDSTVVVDASRNITGSNATLSGTLFVDGNTTIDANLSASGNLDVDGTGRVDGNLRTQGLFSINSSPTANVSMTVLNENSNGDILNAQNTEDTYGTFLSLLTDTYDGATNFDFIAVGVNNSNRATDPKDGVLYMYQDNDWNIWVNNTKILKINSDGLNVLEGSITSSNNIYASSELGAGGNLSIDGNATVLGSTTLGDSSTGDTHSITGITSVTGSFAVDNISLDGQQISSLTGDLELNSQGVVDIKTNITASGNNLEFNHTGTGNFTFSSENGNILIESTQFSGDDVIVAGNVAINGGDITTTDTTANIFNANATSLNLAGAATSIEIGSTSGTTSINHNLTVDGDTTLGNADADRVDILGETIALSGSNVTLEHDSPNGEFRIQTLGGTNNKLILGSSGDIDIEQSMTMRNLNTSFQSSGSISGFTGQGFDISFASQSSAEFDNLTIRGSMRVFELIINQIRATNGSLFVSSVGKVDSVVDLGTTDGQGRQEFALLFDTGSGDIGHGFVENDIIRAQRVNRNAIAQAGVTQSVDDNLVFRSDLTVTSVQDLKLVTASLAPGSTPPSSSFDYVRLGNTTNVNRQGNVYLTSDDNYAPFIDVVDGITDHSDWNNSAVSGGVKVRVGKIDGINSPEFGDLHGYGMWASGSVYLEGSINATAGLVGGWAIEPGYLESNNIRLQSSGSAGGELLKIGSAAGMTGNGIFLSGSGEFNLQAGTNEFIRQSNNLLDIKSSEFSLSTGQLTISGSSSTGFISLGTLTDSTTVSNTNNGFFVSSSGEVLIKGGSIADNKFIKVGSSGIDIKSTDFGLKAGTLTVSGSSSTGFIKIGSLNNATTVGTTNSGFYADNSGNVLIKGSSNGSNYLKIDGSGTIDLNSDNFTLTGGSTLKLTNDNGGLLTFGDTVYAGATVAISGSGEAKFGDINVDGRNGGSIFSGTTNINSTLNGIFLSGSGEFNFVKDSNNYIRRVGDEFELAATTASLSGENVIIDVSNLDINTPTFDLTTANGGQIALGGSSPSLVNPGIFLSGSGEFNFQLDSDNRITLDGTTLDLRAENLVAKGDTVEISGSNFHLLNGNITASNVDLSGNINAQTGTIGGFSIDADLEATSGLLTLKGATGEITGSQVLFTGGKISGSAIEFDVTNFVAKGDTVEISGSNFHLQNGNIIASNVDLSGNINAQTGTIGGFSISEDALSSGNNFFISGSATNNEFFISSSKFNVKANGDVTASNANITGDIVATNITAINQGNIAGFTLTANQLSDSGNNLVLKSSGQITGSNVLFTGGKISGSAIEFDVTEFVAKGNNVEISGSSFHLLNGNITASNVDLSGEINAESGTIGGFSIGNGVLNSGNSFFISGSATGNNYFISSSKFHVTAGGDVTAEDASFTGTSEADAFAFELLKITNSNQSDYLKATTDGYYVLDLSGGTPGTAQFIRFENSITPNPVIITHIVPPNGAGASKGFRVVLEGTSDNKIKLRRPSGGATLSSTTLNYNGSNSISDIFDIGHDSDDSFILTNSEYSIQGGERVDLIKSANDYKIQSTNKIQDLRVNGSLTVNGSSVLTSANAGSGNSLDSDTVDGLEASQFLRSDGDDSTSGALTINGTLLKSTSSISVDNTTANILTTTLASFDAVFFDYVIKNGSNLRAGTVYAVHDGTNVEFTETSTQDLGDTSDVTLFVDILINLRLRATTTSNGWTIKAFARGL